MNRPIWLTGLAGALLSASLTVAPASSANAEDFFSALFHALGGRPQARQVESSPLSYGSEAPLQFPSRPSDSATVSSGTAYCVRSCDGRYFPAPGAANQSRADTCKSFCPAAETTVFYGRNIDGATSDAGKAYSELPNAYKYRSELVAGCSCNGTDPVGLARIKIDDDKTLRRGDIVAGPDGLMVAAGKSDKRGASVNFSPAPAAIRSRFQRPPLIAQD